MKNFDVKIFETHFDNEGFNRIKEELNKNPNFVINFEPDNKVKYDMENDKITKNVNLTNNILINLMCFAIAIPLLVLGAQLIIDDIITSLLFIIIGGGILIYRISKISKSIINKFTKRL